MAFVGSAQNVKPLNVLTLDGGGVRGLSSLLILQELMRQINLSIKSLRPPDDPCDDVEPHEIFDLVAGTSTGGLIAIMLGKLGMTIEECIAAYHSLSKSIFSKKHLRGRATGGLAPTRYSGKRLQGSICKLLQDKGFDEGLSMGFVDGEDKIACAVVCREHETESSYSRFKSDPVHICSLPCPEDALVCLVYEAARATSAAPTYFPVQKIAGRSFVDGGMEFNNPSYTIFEHYTERSRVARSRRTSVAMEWGPQGVPTHDKLEFSQVRIVNLGTGTEPTTSNGRRGPGFFAHLVPPALRRLAFLKRTLTKIATNSENEAKKMVTIARVSQSGDNPIEFKRFSANNGVCYIDLDKYKELEEGKKIETLTREYLGIQKTQDELQQVAKDIARDYLDAHRAGIRPTSLAVPDGRSSRPRASVLHSALPMPQNTPSTLNTESSRSTSGNYSETSHDNGTSGEPSTQPSTIELSTEAIGNVSDPMSIVPPGPAGGKVGHVESGAEPPEPGVPSSPGAGGQVLKI